ncbi:MAG: YfcC family protein, partial [Pseudomonadota bacterium]
CSGFLCRHALRVKSGKTQPIGYDVSDTPSNGIDDLTFRQIAVLGVFGVAFATMIWGVSSQGWWMTEMSALFIAASVIAGFIGWLGERMPV